MGKLLIAAATTAAGLLLGSGAVAQAYKAEDVIAKFRVPGNLGAPRALCIGTESECAKDVPSPAKRGEGFDLVVNFEYNSDVLARSARANLDEFAKALKDPRLGSAAFVVEGHTDGKGGDEYNLDLSMRRANAVVSYLRSLGVSTEKLEAKGYGKQRLLVSDPMASSNRRVETRLRSE